MEWVYRGGWEFFPAILGHRGFLMGGSYCYEYPRPMVTVDAAVFSRVEGRWCVLLIQRGNPPFEGRWALPGGFVDMEETLEAAAVRELREETGMEGVELRQLASYGDPGRDPRGRTISVVFAGVADEKRAGRVKGGDDAAHAAWHPIEGLPELAFDHDRIVADAKEWLRKRMENAE
jgi:8-oxo-dGTP diphosphatase